MANPEHIKIIKQGTHAWNKWLEHQLKIVSPDLRGANLHGADLSGANLRSADLSGANLRAAELSGADLRSADLNGATLSDATLSDADLLGADLRGANLSDADLSLAHLHSADLRGANLRSAELSGADLRLADLSGADLSGADLSGANLLGADLRSADLRSSNLSGLDLRGLDLSGANLSGADLRSADLRSSNLSGLDLRGANLALALISYAQFNDAKIHQARLWGTQREHWSIKGVFCDSVYWDEKGETLTHYKPGDFERLFSDKAKLQLFYKDGLNALEIVSLPAFIQHLESLHPGCKLRFKSINEASGGAIVEIVIDEGEQLQPVIEQEAVAAQQKLRLAFEKQEQYLQGKLAGFQEGIQFILKETLPLMSNNSPTININSPVVHGNLTGYVQGDVIYNAAQLGEAGKLVESLAAKAETIPALAPAERQELNQALTTAKTELSKPEPSHPLLKGALQTVRSILEKSAAQWLTSHAGDIWEALQKLPHLPM